jgi:hypothetical protein
LGTVGWQAAMTRLANNTRASSLTLNDFGFIFTACHQSKQAGLCRS